MEAEGVLRYVARIELMDCNKISVSDHLGFLIDVDLVVHFSEELVEGNLRQKMYLNPNRKTHSDICAKTCE